MNRLRFFILVGGVFLLAGCGSQTSYTLNEAKENPFLYLFTPLTVPMAMAMDGVHSTTGITPREMYNGVSTANTVVGTAAAIKNGGSPPPANTPYLSSSAGGAGSRVNRQEVANACSAKARNLYSRQAQNVLLQQAACIYYCAYRATGDGQYNTLYLESQNNANSLCSNGGSCNAINLAACSP